MATHKVQIIAKHQTASLITDQLAMPTKFLLERTLHQSLDLSSDPFFMGLMEYTTVLMQAKWR